MSALRVRRFLGRWCIALAGLLCTCASGRLALACPSYDPGDPCPYSKAWASTDQTDWVSSTIAVAPGTTVYFKATRFDGGSLADQDWDTDRNVNYAQGAGTFKCEWDFSYVYDETTPPDYGFNVEATAGVNAQVQRTFNTVGSYAVKARTDDVWPGTWFNDPPRLSSNAVTVHVIKVDIKQGESTITDLTQDTIVGRQINLQGVVSPGGVTVSAHQWSVPPRRIANYTADINSATVTELTELSSASVSYYWVDGADGREVTYTATVAGQQFSTKTTFNVKKPSGDVFSATGTIEINEAQTLLQYGDPAGQPGVRFELTDFAEPEGFSGGTTAWFQAIDYTEVWRQEVLGAWWAVFGSNLCDLPVEEPRFPYSTSPVSSDSPAIVLESPYWYYERCDGFSTYLMYKPSGPAAAIWVPVVRMEWGWVSSADHFGEAWELIAAFADTPSGTPWPDHPRWSANSDSLEWVLQE